MGGPPPQGPVSVLAGLMDGNGCSIGTHILSYKPNYSPALYAGIFDAGLLCLPVTKQPGLIFQASNQRVLCCF